MFMEVTVINSVQTIVQNQDVTFPMERVSIVPLDGWEIYVEMVRKKLKPVFMTSVDYYGRSFLYIESDPLLLYQS